MERKCVGVKAGWLAGLLALMLPGCATAPIHLPRVRGTQISPGVRTFADLGAANHPHKLAPWAPSPAFPALSRHPTHAVARRTSLAWRVEARGPLQATTYLAFRAYKDTLSRFDGNTCRFVPSCSRFALDAVGRYGLTGIILAFARLSRDHNDTSFYLPGRFPYLKDPLSDYVFWLERPRLDNFAAHADRAQAWYQLVQATRRLRWDDRHQKPAGAKSPRARLANATSGRL